MEAGRQGALSCSVIAAWRVRAICFARRGRAGEKRRVVASRHPTRRIPVRGFDNGESWLSRSSIDEHDDGRRSPWVRLCRDPRL